jgi:soluble P-type ATPase
MPYIMNASSREQTVQVHGSWFTFAPGGIKEMNDNKVHFLASSKAYMGFVEIPEKFSDLSYRQSPDGAKQMEEFRQKGVAARIKHLEWLKNNELKSLREDMDRKNIKAETTTEMGGESFSALESALTELKGYKTKTNEAEKERQEKLKELTAALAEIEE